jgi:signal transduction histidine kinase
MHIVTVVAREAGNSLEQLYLTDRVREVGIREDRLHFSRDLHDGVLQALTGIRLELQDIAATVVPGAADRLFAIERALAIEQRELRLFIDQLKPGVIGSPPSGPIATRLEEMRATLTAEWKIPITLHVQPLDLALPQAMEQAVRLMIHEGTSNALRHALPSRVSISIEAGASELSVIIADDGQGFGFQGRFEHADLVRVNTGPVSLRERVAALRGRLSVDSKPTGSQVEFVIPL